MPEADNVGLHPDGRFEPFVDDGARGARSPAVVADLAVLYADIEGSTTLAQTFPASDQKRYARLVADYYAVMRQACRAHAGAEGGTWGDGFYAVFRSSREAVRAAIEVQRAAAAHAWPGGVEVRIRIALVRGRLLHSDAGYFGLTLHRAARICALAAGGQILASRALVDEWRVSGDDETVVTDLGRYRLRDVIEPEFLVAISAPGLAHEELPATAFAVAEMPFTEFVGRRREIAEVREILHRSGVRLLSLLGPGGVGKTRLAREVAALEAAWFADGVLFVELADLRDGAAALSRIVDELGLVAESGVDTETLLARFLFGREMLLVLDNCEQVDAAAPAVRSLLAMGPHLRVLVTSRVPVGLRGEHHYQVEPLAVPPTDLEHTPDALAFDAPALFLRRAREVDPRFAPSLEQAGEIVSICRLLDGLPLALELAASHVGALSLAQLKAQLRERALDVLSDTGTDAPARQQAIDRTIAWSYERIADAETRALFERLSVFAGGFTLEAVMGVEAALGDAAPDAVALGHRLQTLHLSGLVQALPAADVMRFRLLNVIREFARRRLAQRDAAAAVRSAHLRYFASVAREAELALQGPGQRQALDALEADLGNLREALTWARATPADSVRGLGLASALTLFWWHRHLAEGADWLRALLDRAEDADSGRRAQAELTVAFLEFYGGSLTRSAEYVRRCLAQDATGPRVVPVRGLSLCLSGVLAASEGRFAEASDLAAQGVAMLEAMQGTWVMAIALGWQGDVAARVGDHSLAASAWKRSVETLRAIGDRWLIAAPLARLGELALADGDLVTARTRMSESIEMWRAVGSGAGIAQVLAGLGRLAHAEGRAAEAAAYADEAIRTAAERQTHVELSLGVSLAATLAFAGGEGERAAQLLTAADTIRDAGGRIAAATVLAEEARLAGELRAQLGDDAFAETSAEGRGLAIDEIVRRALATTGATTPSG